MMPWGQELYLCDQAGYCLLSGGHCTQFPVSEPRLCSAGDEECVTDRQVHELDSDRSIGQESSKHLISGDLSEQMSNPHS